MSKIKWKIKEDVQKEQVDKNKFKEKEVGKMTVKERNELLEKIAKNLGYI